MKNILTEDLINSINAATDDFGGVCNDEHEWAKCVVKHMTLKGWSIIFSKQENCKCPSAKP